MSWQCSFKTLCFFIASIMPKIILTQSANAQIQVIFTILQVTVDFHFCRDRGATLRFFLGGPILLPRPPSSAVPEPARRRF